MSDPLEAAAHALEISDSNPRMSYRQAAEQVVRVYLSAKVNEMNDTQRRQFAFSLTAWGSGDARQRFNERLLECLLPVVSEDGGAP